MHWTDRRTDRQIVRCTDTSDPGHFGISAEVSVRHFGTSTEVSYGHVGTSLWKIVLHLRISEMLLLMWRNAVTVDVWSRLNSSCFFGKCVDPLSHSVMAVVCRLFEVNRVLSWLSLSTKFMWSLLSCYMLSRVRTVHCNCSCNYQWLKFAAYR